MKLINKTILTLVLSLFMVVAFSQQASFEKNNLNNNLSNEIGSTKPQISTYSSQMDNESEVLSTGDPGGQIVPIDDYQFYLVGLGVLLTGIVVYRRKQLQQA